MERKVLILAFVLGQMNPAHPHVIHFILCYQVH